MTIQFGDLSAIQFKLEEYCLTLLRDPETVSVHRIRLTPNGDRATINATAVFKGDIRIELEFEIDRASIFDASN